MPRPFLTARPPVDARIHSSLEKVEMSHSVRTLMSVAALAALAACSNDSPLPPSAPGVSASQNNGLAMRLQHAKVCPSAEIGAARCHALVRVDDAAQPLATSGPSGYGPADLLSAYN